jgi:hypothetical protein
LLFVQGRLEIVTLGFGQKMAPKGFHKFDGGGRQLGRHFPSNSPPPFSIPSHHPDANQSEKKLTLIKQYPAGDGRIAWVD